MCKCNIALSICKLNRGNCGLALLFNSNCVLLIPEEGMNEDTPQDLSVGKESIVPRAESPSVDTDHEDDSKHSSGENSTGTILSNSDSFIIF